MAKTGILVHLKPDMIEELNVMAHTIGISRSELIRRCLGRDLEFVREFEIPGLRALVASNSAKHEKFRHQSITATLL